MYLMLEMLEKVLSIRWKLFTETGVTGSPKITKTSFTKNIKSRKCQKTANKIGNRAPKCDYSGTLLTRTKQNKQKTINLGKPIK